MVDVGKGEPLVRQKKGIPGKEGCFAQRVFTEIFKRVSSGRGKRLDPKGCYAVSSDELHLETEQRIRRKFKSYRSVKRKKIRTSI